MGKITLKSKILNDEYTEFVYSAFDIQDQDETTVEVKYFLGDAKDFEWNIGVIYGSSGSGKSTILNKLGAIESVEFSKDKPLISNFDWLNPEEATMLLTSMGLASVPTWLRPYNALSNGEKYRAELAYKVSKAEEGSTILIDEYTSVVDRDVAKAMSYALQKYIRKQGKQIILASCHYDIMEWLMPDWTCSPQKGGVLERGEWLRQGKPEIQLQVSRVEADTWNLFKKHHYLTEKLNKSAKCFLFTWNDKPIGFCAVLNTPRKGTPHAMAISRVVVLPDFQGLGLGTKICNFIGGVFTQDEKLMYIKTVNPALGIYFNKSEIWAPTSYNGKFRKETKFEGDKYKNRVQRVSYCHRFEGDGIEGYEELMLPVAKMRKNKLIKS